MIKINNITKSFGKQRVLNGVNLEIKSGSIQSLLGANGAGKTTLVHIIAELMKCESGDVSIGEEMISVNSWKFKTETGFVFEQPVYIEKFTARECLTFVGKMYNIPDNELLKRVNDFIVFFEFPDKKYIEKYSKGMKSKVSLACSLIHNPKYLILDEPFDGIDFVSVQKISRTLTNMAKNGCTILITSHQYDIIAGLCHKFALLKNGKIVFNNTLNELYQMAADWNNTDNSVKTYLEYCMNNDESELKQISWLEKH
jgi:ABC-2 type transport system ATP-binding protein